MKDVRDNNFANEDKQFRAYLVGHGWNGDMGEDDLQAIADKDIPPAMTELAREEH